MKNKRKVIKVVKNSKKITKKMKMKETKKKDLRKKSKRCTKKSKKENTLKRIIAMLNHLQKLQMQLNLKRKRKINSCLFNN